MVKRQYDNVDRYMMEYKMRTPYATPTQMNRFSSNQQTSRSIRRHNAHERSHLKHNPTDPFYHSEGRIDKNTKQKQNHHQEDEYKTDNYYHETITTLPKQSSCCTIL